MIVVVAVVGLLILMPLARVIGTRSAETASLERHGLDAELPHIWNDANVHESTFRMLLCFDCLRCGSLTLLS